MKEKIIALLGPKNAHRIERKIIDLGRPDVYEAAEKLAREELGPDATEETLIARAAIRVQQLLGCIVRNPAPAPQPARTAPAPVLEKSKREVPLKVGGKSSTTEQSGTSTEDTTVA